MVDFPRALPNPDAYVALGCSLYIALNSYHSIDESVCTFGTLSDETVSILLVLLLPGMMWKTEVDTLP